MGLFSLTLYTALDLLVGENSDKDLFVSMTLWIVHQANISARVHELGGGTDVQCSVVNPTGIFHFACRLEDLEKRGKDTYEPFWSTPFPFQRFSHKKNRPSSEEATIDVRGVHAFYERRVSLSLCILLLKNEVNWSYMRFFSIIQVKSNGHEGFCKMVCTVKSRPSYFNGPTYFHRLINKIN